MYLHEGNCWICGHDSIALEDSRPDPFVCHKCRDVKFRQGKDTEHVAGTNVIRRLKVKGWYRIESVEQSTDATGALAAQEARVRKAISGSGANLQCPPSSYEMYDIDTLETIDRSPEATAIHDSSKSLCKVCQSSTPGGLGYYSTNGAWREVCKKCAQTALRIFEDERER